MHRGSGARCGAGLPMVKCTFRQVLMGKVGCMDLTTVLLDRGIPRVCWQRIQPHTRPVWVWSWATGLTGCGPDWPWLQIWAAAMVRCRKVTVDHGDRASSGGRSRSTSLFYPVTCSLAGDRLHQRQLTTTWRQRAALTDNYFDQHSSQGPA